MSTEELTQARRLLEEDKRARGEECQRRIDAALQELRCQLVAFVIVNDQRVPVTVRIVAQ